MTPQAPSLQEQLDELRWDPEFGLRELEDDIAEQVVCLLDANERNQTWLAERLGVSRQRVSNLLSGSQNMTLLTVVKLAFAFGLRPSVHLDASRCLFTLDGLVLENVMTDAAFSGSLLDTTNGSYKELVEPSSSVAVAN